MKKTFLLLFVLTMYFVSFGQKLPFQGKLIESGVPVNGTRSLTFAIDTSWAETHADVSITDGLYFVVLGSTNPLPGNLFYQSDERQMSINVNGTELGPVTLYKPLAGSQDGLNVKGRTTGTLQGGFFTGSPESENLPYLRFVGNNSNFMNLFMTVTRDTANVESGYLRLRSTQNNWAVATPEEIWFRDNTNRYVAQIKSLKGNTNQYSGQFWLRGPNSMNVEVGSKHWENADLPWLNMIGTSGNSVITLSGEKFDENTPERERGQIIISDTDQKKLWLNSTEFNLQKSDGTNVAGLSSEGDAGNLFLRGPNTDNFYLGSASWENPDRPYMRMNGIDNQVKMTVTTIEDGNGERGIITLTNNNGDETTYGNNGTWGTGTFNMWSGAMVNGALTVYGDINGSGTNNYNSDKRLKKEIQPLDSDVLGKIKKMGGYSYYWRKDEFPKKNFSDAQQIGLIAQELEEQFPALVKTGEDGYKSVNYNGFTAVLLEAVKELNAKVDKLESENSRLQAELSASAGKPEEMAELKKQVDFLTKMVQEKIISASKESEKTASKN